MGAELMDQTRSDHTWRQVGWGRNSEKPHWLRGWQRKNLRRSSEMGGKKINRNNICGSRATDIGFGRWSLLGSPWRMLWRPGASCQLAVETSRENLHHPSSARRQLQFCLFMWSPHTYPLGSTIWFSHRADGMLAGVAPALQSSPSVQLWQCLVEQTRLAHWCPVPGSHWASLARAHLVPTNEAFGAKIGTVSFCSQFLDSHLLHISGGRERAKERERRREGVKEKGREEERKEERETVETNRQRSLGTWPWGLTCMGRIALRAFMYTEGTSIC